ncbi:hypothetical protein [Candidatus Trichorickettsia mobilis]|uniref:hypothetical protein n=1 Tax=Candidatus Trichorickettsia mobilis TaxID=1346319 RepID=UPI00292CEF48|nr:hypothetical protein [Candidatus Trichorickettsia mobilis]
MKEEGAIVTKLILLFAQKVGCDVGDNCLLKWNTQNESAKFSITWSKQCGPIIDEIYQLGDNGHGSTFICNYHPNNKICCWPLGYDYIQEFVICSQ